MTSQEIQIALEAQTKVIEEKRTSVMEDLAKVEPAVIEAQQGKPPRFHANSCPHITATGSPSSIAVHQCLEQLRLHFCFSYSLCSLRVKQNPEIHAYLEFFFYT